jgi:hypothetical protein
VKGEAEGGPCVLSKQQGLFFGASANQGKAPPLLVFCSREREEEAEKKKPANPTRVNFNLQRKLAHKLPPVANLRISQLLLLPSKARVGLAIVAVVFLFPSSSSSLLLLSPLRGATTTSQCQQKLSPPLCFSLLQQHTHTHLPTTF